MRAKNFYKGEDGLFTFKVTSSHTTRRVTKKTEHECMCHLEDVGFTLDSFVHLDDGTTINSRAYIQAFYTANRELSAAYQKGHI